MIRAATFASLASVAFCIEASAAVCELPAQPQVIRKDSKVIAMVFTLSVLKSDALFSTNFEPSADDIRYKNFVEFSFPSDMKYNALGALEHHRGLIANADWMDKKTKAKELALMNSMIAFAKTRIRPINCLEKALFRIFDEFVSPDFRYSEFGAIVLKSPDKKTLRVHFASDRSTTNGGLSLDSIAASIEFDRKQGFSNWMHIHNHPFDFENPVRDFAPIGPSNPDLEAYVKDDFDYGVITNGLDTFSMEREVYRAIRRAGELH